MSVDNVITKRCSKQSHGCSCQGCKATNHTVTLRNLPNPASGTYTSTRRNSPEPSGPSGTCLRNLHQHTPELAGNLRNRNQHTLEPSRTSCTSTHRNPPEPPTPAHTTFRNLTPELHQHRLEPSRTFRNLPPEPTPAHTGTFWEPSGTCSRNLNHHTPEPSRTFGNLPPEPAPATRTGTHRSLSGLKTPISLCCWGKSREMLSSKQHRLGLRFHRGFS